MKSKPHGDEELSANRKISRRKFLRGAGVTTIGVAVAGGMLARTEVRTGTQRVANILGPGPFPIQLQINGKSSAATVDPGETLAETLRDRLHLTGTKISCDRGACGSCTVLIDGQPVCSCMTLAIDAVGHRVETIEGLMDGDQLHALQQSFIDHDGLQCGFCTSGMIMSCKALLDHHPRPSSDDVRQAVSGNLCRCGTYPKVIDAVLGAAQRLERKG